MTISNGTRRGALALALILVTAPVHGDLGTSSVGQSGLVHMPDGRVAPVGTLRGGVTYMEPYGALWGNIVLLPWFEFSGRYTRVDSVPGFRNIPEFGDYKDKAFDLKIRLLEETDTLPAIAVGWQDFHGTGIFPGQFVAASKYFDTGFGGFDVTLGYGRKRFDGAFGGVRWDVPGVERLSLFAEWDGYDYDNDFYARRADDVIRRGGTTLGVQYSFHEFTGQLAHQDGEWGFNLYMTVPLQHRSFVPKSEEPQPVPVDAEPPASVQEWQETPESLQPMFRSLAAEGFSGIRLRVEGDTVLASISHARISTIGRAAGRGARIVALHAPPDAKRLELTYVEGALPVATYRFDDLELLRGWHAGTVPPPVLQQTLGLSYASADAHALMGDEGLDWYDAFGTPDPGWVVNTGPARFGFPITVRRNTPSSATLRIQPIRMSFVFNDPGGALRHDVYSQVQLSKYFDHGFFASTSARITLDENVSSLLAQSNSLLPRVRSDMWRYRREGGRVKLGSAIVGHIGNPADRVYTLASAGILEEMFSGVGGEVLYLPERGNWAADFSAFGVRQRDFSGGFGLQDYETVTALGSFHYRIPRHGLTVTTRAGRFLAGDYGARVEVKRRFLSGFEVGGWYSHTDAKDITSPGSPDSPYRDKGVFIRFAFGPLMPYDTNASATLAMSAWTRDPGQMVRAPGNLYDMFERRLLLNLSELGPWSDFGD